MFSRRGLLNGAVRGFLIVVLILLAQQNEAIGQDSKTNTEANQSAAPSAEGYDRFFWKYHEGKPEAYWAVCEKPQNRADADLCQQWRMAEATVKQADLTDKLLTFTIIEIVALLAVLGLNIYALFIGRRATAAAVESNNIARDTAKQELRAYISIKDAWIDPADGGTPVAKLRIRNGGHTPAYNLRHMMTVMVGETKLDSRPPKNLRRPKCDVGPDQHLMLYLSFPWLNAEQQNLFRHRALPMFVGGTIHYDDAFGKHRYTRFRLYLETGPDVNPERLSLIPCHKGNRSN